MHPFNRHVITTATFLGCALSSAAPRDAGNLAQEDRLSGVWRVSLLRGNSERAPSESDSATFRGAVSLLRMAEPLAQPWLSLGEPTHFGVYTFSRKPLEVPPAIAALLRRQLPTAGARLMSGDSVRVVIDPQMDHGALILEGKLAGDSITGHWMVSGYISTPGGRFVMRRYE
jgi:hypothetical protein